MLFAVLTKADPRSTPAEDYLKLVQDGHKYVAGLIEKRKILHAFVRAGMPAGLLIIDADSAEELEHMVQGNPTATYARYEVIPLADPEKLSYNPFLSIEREVKIDQDYDNACDFEDFVIIKADKEKIYGYLWNVGNWPVILPHVKEIHMIEENDSYQEFEMEVNGEAGVQKNRSKRYGTQGISIRYEQTTPPPLFISHTGVWILEPAENEVKVISRHSIRINEGRIPEVLGQPYSMEEAKDLVRHFVGNHSLMTLNKIKELSEREYKG